MQLSRWSAALMAIAVTACGPVNTATTVPSIASVPSAPASPGATPGQTPSNTAIPTFSASPGADNDSVWQVATGFPPRGAAIVDLAVIEALGRPGLIAGGHIQAGTAECPHRTTAALWESAEGLEWEELLVDRVSNSALTAFAYPALALGHTGSPGCPGDGVREWGPTDKADWYGTDAVGYEPGDVVVDAVYIEVDSRAVATGWAAGNGAAWITKPFAFTGRWQPVESPPRGIGQPLVALATSERTVVGWDGSSTVPAWHSADGGDTWANADFYAPYWFAATGAVSVAGRFFAAGSACCTVPGVHAGTVLSSADGISWSGSESTILGSVPEAIVATPSGLAAFGDTTYLSSDGSRWTVGPPLPGYDGEERLTAAASGGTILVASPTRMWVARASDLMPEGWPNDAQSPELPEVGSSHTYHLPTVCAPRDTSIHFDLRTWIPDHTSLRDGEWPRSYDNDEDWGHVTFVEEHVLEFTGDGSGANPGAVVRFVPTDDPPQSGSCT